MREGGIEAFSSPKRHIYVMQVITEAEEFIVIGWVFLQYLYPKVWPAVFLLLADQPLTVCVLENCLSQEIQEKKQLLLARNCGRDPEDKQQVKHSQIRAVANTELQKNPRLCIRISRYYP